MKKHSEETLNYKQLKKQFLKKSLEIKIADRASQEKIVSERELKQVAGKHRHFMLHLD